MIGMAGADGTGELRIRYFSQQALPAVPASSRLSLGILIMESIFDPFQSKNWRPECF